MKSLITLSIALFLLATAVVAEPLTIGSMPARGGQTTMDAGTPTTFIDVSHPARTSGNIELLSFRWRKSAKGVCADAYTFKVLRPGALLGTWTVVRASIPISNDTDVWSVGAANPLTVAAGDVLAITVLKPLADCGSILLTPDAGSITYVVPGNIQNNVAPVGVIVRHGYALNAFAVDKSHLYATLPVVGSAAGSNNSFFRTAIQLINPTDGSAVATFRFHPAGQSGKNSDPSFSVDMDPRQTRYFSDIVGTQLKQAGIGSLDIVSFLPPVITARIYNDNGTAGTQGFTEEVVTTSEIMHAPQQGVLPFPGDAVAFRMNIGVRTFDEGASISFATFSKTGAPGNVMVRTYGPNFFEQFVSSALGETEGWIQVYVTAGSAVVYGSYTDNRTNDSSLRYATAN